MIKKLVIFAIALAFVIYKANLAIPATANLTIPIFIFTPKPKATNLTPFKHMLQKFAVIII
jgi:hypothetical protein